MQVLPFDSPKEKKPIIKVIGVGGCGNNAVDFMYNSGIHGVDFINCNTDSQVLEASPVPQRIQFGSEGHGAGNNPERGRFLAESSSDELREKLADTEMLFITAGMGGGTGTGATPVIAAIAKELGILTVAVVTEPFSWEGSLRKEQAQQGFKSLFGDVDVLLILKNDKLREHFGKLPIGEAFHKSDEVLINAVKSIAEIITVRGYVNMDLEDVKAAMKNSGTAVMGVGIVEKIEDRATKLVKQALDSPLLDNIDISSSKALIVYITHGNDQPETDEMEEITDLIYERTGKEAHLNWGIGYNEALGDKMAISIIATGFKDVYGYAANQPPVQKYSTIPSQQIIHSLENTPAKAKSELIAQELEINNLALKGKEENIEESKVITISPAISQSEIKAYTATQIRFNESETKNPVVNVKEPENATSPSQNIKHIFVDDDEFYFGQETNNNNSTFQTNLNTPDIMLDSEGKIVEKKTSRLQQLGEERAERLRNNSSQFKPKDDYDYTLPSHIQKRIELDSIDHSSETQVSKYVLYQGEDDRIELKQNSYLNDNPD